MATKSGAYGANDTAVAEPGGAYSASDTPADAPPAGKLRRAADTALALGRGIVAVPETAVGISDLITGGRTGKAVERLGVRFKDAKQVLTDFQSDEQKAADASVQQADGFLPTVGAMVENPSTIANAVAESVPSMLAGGAVSRGLVNKGVGGITAGAVGEGVVSAGQAAEQVRQEGPTGFLTPKQAALAATSGAATGVINRASGKMADKLGIGDVNTAMATGKLGGTTERGIAQRTAYGALNEGVLQELPQSMQEQAAQNLALDKPVGEGVAEAGAAGMLVGNLTGAAFGAVSREPQAPAIGVDAPDVGAVNQTTPQTGAIVSVQGGGIAPSQAPQNTAQNTPAAPPAPPPSKAQAMGINPAAGPLSAGAAIAVDTGADVITQTQEVEKQKAEAAAKEKAKPGADGKKPEPEAPAPVQPAPADPTAPITGPFTKAIHGAANVTPTPAPAVDPQGPATSEGVGAQPDAPAAPGVGADQGPTGAGAVPVAVPEPGNPALTPPPTQEIPNATQESIDPETGEITQGRSADSQAQPAQRGTAGPTTQAAAGAQGAGGDGGQRPADALDPGADAKGPQPAPDQPAAPTAASTPPEGKPAAPVEPVDLGAHTAATSPHNDRPEPTQAQKEAGNAKLGHIVMNGVGLSIENPEGSTRKSKPGSPVKWETTMKGGHYGYVKGSIGMDGDHVDTFIKPGTPLDHAGTVFVIDQIDPATGKPDEHKVMIGYPNGMAARQAYQGNYQKGWKGFKAITPMAWDEFKAWVKSDGTKSPAARSEPAPVAPPPADTPVATDTTSSAVAPPAPDPAPTQAAAPSKAESVSPAATDPLLDGTPATTKSNTLRVGTMPTNAEPVTIKDGVIFIGKYEALNFDTGEPVRIAPDANPMQIRKALADNKALGAHQKVFGGETKPAIGETAKPIGETPAPQSETQLAKPETLPAKPTGGKNLRAAAYEKNPLLTFLAQHGLFHDKDKPGSQKAEFSPDKQVMVMGYGPVFRKTGMKPDLLTELAIEDGYLPPDADESQMVDLIRSAIGGERIAPLYTEGAAETEMQKRMQAVDDLRELDDNEAAGPDPDIFRESNASTEDAMRALGFTEQEIHDATTQGPRKPQEGSQGRGEPDEAQTPTAPGGAQAGPPAPAELEGPSEGLTAPTRADVLRQQDAADNAQASDQRAQIDREAGAQTLTAQTAPEQRRDTTGDIFGGPSPEEAMAAKARDDEAKAKKKAAEDAASGQAGMFDQREASAPVTPAEQSKPKDRLTDAGEELIRNRRGKLKGLAWDDVSAMNDTLKVAQVIKSNVWPRPDYAKMVEDGAPAWKAASLKAVYDKLAAAPVTRTAPTDADLRAYIETMNQVRETLMAELDRVERDGTGDKLWASLEKANVFGKVFPIPTDAKPVFGYPSAFDRVSAQGKENNRRALLIGGNAAVQALQFNYKMTSKVKDLLAEGFPKKQEAWEKSYEVRQTETRDNDVPEGERTGEPQQRFYIYEKGSRWRLAKGVKDGGYATQEQAEAFARTLTAKKRDVLPPSRGLDLADVSRTGPDWRKGQNVTADQVMEHFGFRGVNLGEYVKAKQEIAQAHLNHAFDAFNDLADLLGVPPKAMSLNGTLGVAIGAQGSGKALAHFVPGVNEINITRDSGAGALAHEFGHAVDHYFATQHGRAVSMAKRPYLSAAVDKTQDAGNVRPEVMDAMRTVMKAINTRPMTEAEAKKYMADQRALNERRMDRWVTEFKGNRGADPEALAAVAEKLKRGDVGEVRDDDVESNLAEFMRAAGLKPGNSLAANAFTTAYRLRDLADEARFMASHIPQLETNYSKASAAMDAKKTGDGYWGTPWEKFARAFETFVMDALADRQRESLYLSGLVDGKGWQTWADATGKSAPYPSGDERLVMQQAFQKLVDTIQTKEDDAGNVAMFARSKRTGGVHMDDAEAIIASIREALPTAPPIIPLESIAQAPADLRKFIRDAGAQDDFEAAYHNGKIYVLPSNVGSTTRLQFLLAHHEIRHHGLGAMLGPRKNAVMFAIHATNANVRAAAAEQVRKGYAASKVLATEEALADMPVEDLVKLTGWDKIVAAVREWLRGAAMRLRRVGLGNVADAIEPSAWTDKDVAALVARAEGISRGGSAKYATEGTVFGQDSDMPAFYSALTREINANTARAQPAMGWASTIQGLVKAGKIKQDEVDWSGVLDWLRLQGTQPVYEAGFGLVEEMKNDAGQWQQVDDLGMYYPTMEEAKAAVTAEIRESVERHGREEQTEARIGFKKFDSLDFGKRTTAKITREQLVQFLDANGVRVEETVLGGGNKPPGYDADLELLSDNGLTLERNPEDPSMVAFMDENGDLLSADELAEEPGLAKELVLAAYRVQEAADADKVPTRYANYQLPGGTNYREVLLTLPASDNGDAEAWWNDEGGANEETPFRDLSERERRDAVRRYREEVGQYAESAGTFKSSHWDQPNVLAHIRVNDRVDVDGKRVLFVEEIQSDWGQAGKKQGFDAITPKFVPQVAPGERRALIVAMTEAFRDKLVAAGVDSATATTVAEKTGHDVLSRTTGMVAEYQDLLAREDSDRQAERASKIVGIPSAPFVTKTDAWLSLALKRIVKMAVDEGYDRVAFVNGDQSAERYDLSKQVSRLAYDSDGTLEVFDMRGDNMMTRKASEDELSDLIGKETAQRLIDAPRTPGGRRSLEGDGLKVGGEGMKVFYNRIVPNTLKDVLRKVGGGALEMVSIGTHGKHSSQGVVFGDTAIDPATARVEKVNGAWRVVVGDKLHGTPFSTKKEAQEYIAANTVRSSDQTGFSITPAMRSKVAGGLPLFSRTGDQTSTPAFKKWFGGSKVVNQNGSPMVVYHGTDSDFAAFNAGRGDLGKGIYFASAADDAASYASPDGRGANVMPVYVSIQNPYYWTKEDRNKSADKVNAAARRAGHDGIIRTWADSDEKHIIAFDPAQVKSAIGNNGDFDPTNSDIRFARGGLDSVTDKINTTTKTAGNTAAHYRSLGLQALGRRQITELYGDILPQLPIYNRLMAQMDADKNEAGAEADQIAQDWGKLKDERQLAELMHDATLAQMDPEKPLMRGDDPLTYEPLRERYAALSPEAKKVYVDARDTYRTHHENVRKALRDRIERSELRGQRKAELLKQMDDEFYQSVKGVYFPLARFGDYVVIVRDMTGKTVSVNRAETINEAEALQVELRKAYPDMTVGKVLKSKEFNAGRDAVGRGFMQNLYEVLGKKEMDEKQRADLEDMLGQLYLSALPDLSWAKHGIHRKGTPGFSQDARRAFAQNTFHGARYLAKVRHSDLLENELIDAQKQVDSMSESESFESIKAQQVIDEMVKRHDAAMNPNGNALSKALTSLGFVFHLGLSPASAMVNLTQTALVAYPIMGAKWGFTKASTALLKASQQAAANRNDISSALSADEKRAYDEAVRSGVIDVTMAHDLAGISQGEDAKVSWKLRPVMRWASFLFHHAEKFNRQVTFVASYRLAREAGTAPAQAYEQAVKATYDGHFDYGQTNRPRMMQGNTARVLLLFKQYAQNMVYTLTRQAYLAIKGQNPYERAQARKALGGLLAMHAAAAGVLGLPMVSTLLAAASMLGGDDDEPWDAEVALRNMLADALGDQAADVLARGLSRLTPWDISGRVGLDKLILPDIQEGLEGQDLANSVMAAALGPVAGIGVSMFRGMQEITDGNWARGLEAMAPSLARGPLKALRYGTEGAIDRTGKPIVEDVGEFGIAGQALGFSPSEVRLATEAKSAVHQADARLAKRRSTLMRHYALAVIAGDEEGAADAREDILAFNEKNPGRRINPLQMARSVATRRKQIAESEGGVYLPKTRRDAMEAGQFGMP